MFYKHKRFTLNDENREVFDEFGRQVSITGNSYLLLLFLCKEKNLAMITELNDFIDREADINEENIRQYRYKIKLALGHDIIKYKNQRYFIEGEIKAMVDTENRQEAGNRNTDLVRSGSVKLRQFARFPAIISVILLLMAFLSWPYGYYTFLRIAVSAVAIYCIYYLYKNRLNEVLSFWFWGLVFFAVLFNPIFPIYLRREIWEAIDFAAAVFLIGLIFKLNKFNKN